MTFMIMLATHWENLQINVIGKTVEMYEVCGGHVQVYKPGKKDME